MHINDVTLPVSVGDLKKNSAHNYFWVSWNYLWQGNTKQSQNKPEKWSSKQATILVHYVSRQHSCKAICMVTKFVVVSNVQLKEWRTKVWFYHDKGKLWFNT